MAFVSMSDFEDERGRVDWSAYKKAQIANGEVCITCGGFTDYFERRGHAMECRSCRNLRSETDRVEHPSMVRCPKCGDFMDASEMGLYTNNEMQEVWCSCGHKFDVTIRTEWFFTSPPMIQSNEDE